MSKRFTFARFMIEAKFIHVKAAFLLTVFALNTFVCCACIPAFNTILKSQKHGHCSIENQRSSGSCSMCCGERENKNQQKNSEDNSGSCCNNHLNSFSKIDKDVTQTSNFVIPVYSPSLINPVYNTLHLPPGEIYFDAKYFVQGHHPPIANIRIAIMSFQI